MCYPPRCAMFLADVTCARVSHGRGGDQEFYMDAANSHQPHVRVRAHDKYLRLIDAAQKLTPVATAIAHPCDDVSLEGAVEARKLGLIDPILVGPPARIR